MKERPILFSGPMVKAILDGSKTQTRRVMKAQPNAEHFGAVSIKEALRYCPHGLVGDRLWVREAFSASLSMSGDGRAHVTVSYRATEPQPKDTRGGLIPWKPSIHMARMFARITLEITDVRVQRVCDISEEDAIAEGVRGRGVTRWIGEHQGLFAVLWDELNEKRGYSWASNPWVWALTFRRVE